LSFRYRAITFVTRDNAVYRACTVTAVITFVISISSRARERERERERERDAREVSSDNSTLANAFLILQFSTNLLDMLAVGRVIKEKREFTSSTRREFLSRLFSFLFSFFFFLFSFFFFFFQVSVKSVK